ncbi:SseB family protein [Streptomyces sp. NPDC047072]|uniref:SseB family protein n=1 Tax=Streptomyces sp. NPDC047072 TaxID=3154809 RepID=UPI0033DB1416
MGGDGGPSTGTAELRDRMGAFARGEGDPRALVEAVRGAELLLPLLGEDAVWTADLEDIRWVFAFTGTREMHTFLQQKWEAAEPGELPAGLARFARYLAVDGEELLQEMLPAWVGRDRVPMGVVVDVTSDARAFLPPVSGIVPDAIALDRQPVAEGEGAAS